MLHGDKGFHRTSVGRDAFVFDREVGPFGAGRRQRRDASAPLR